MKKYVVQTVYRGVSDLRMRTQYAEFETSVDAAKYLDNYLLRRDIESCVCYETAPVDPHCSPLCGEKRKLKKPKKCTEECHGEG